MRGAATRDNQNKYNYDIICRDILTYLARHPFTKFNRMALIGIFKPEETRHIDQALKKLVTQELVAFQSNGNLFWLTPEEPIHSMLCARFGNVTKSAMRSGVINQEKATEAIPA
jgi:hypothetical protein